MFSLRPAQPNVEDGRRFAHYVNEASHGLVRSLFGPRFERIIAEAFLSPGHDLSYETAVFAETEGRIVGMTSSYSSAQHRESSDKPVIAAAGLQVIRMIPLGILGRRFLAFINTVPDGDFYLAAVAIDDSLRGAGIGSMLIDDVEERAVASGCHRLALDVAVDNTSAIRLYEKRGMSIEAESPSILFRPGQRVLRMVKQFRDQFGQHTACGPESIPARRGKVRLHIDATRRD
jgi:ribosomal protein S18 acetylase RimI-like enzyme